MNAPNHINKQQANEIAKEYVASLDFADDLVIMHEQTDVRGFGWVFSYNSRAFVRSQNMQDAIPGLGPLVVDRNGGTHQLPSLGPTEVMIDQMEQVLEIAQQRLRSEKPEKYQDYYLDKITPIDYLKGLWLVSFDVPNIDGVQVEMEIDSNSGELIKYRDSWS